MAEALGCFLCEWPFSCLLWLCSLQLRFEIGTTALNVMELENEAKRPAPEVKEAADEVHKCDVL